jgi:hypothetical protein
MRDSADLRIAGTGQVLLANVGKGLPKLSIAPAVNAPDLGVNQATVQRYHK